MATLNVTVPDPLVPRIQAALGLKHGLKDESDLPRDATAAEVEEDIRQYLKRTVIELEAAKKRDEIVVPDTGI